MFKNRVQKHKKEPFTIFKRNGKVDIKLEDGIWKLNNATVTIKDSCIKYIDNGTWIKKERI